MIRRLYRTPGIDFRRTLAILILRTAKTAAAAAAALVLGRLLDAAQNGGAGLPRMIVRLGCIVIAEAALTAAVTYFSGKEKQRVVNALYAEGNRTLLQGEYEALAAAEDADLYQRATECAKKTADLLCTSSQVLYATGLMLLFTLGYIAAVRWYLTVVYALI